MTYRLTLECGHEQTHADALEAGSMRVCRLHADDPEKRTPVVSVELEEIDPLLPMNFDHPDEGTIEGAIAGGRMIMRQFARTIPAHRRGQIMRAVMRSILVELDEIPELYISWDER